MDSGNSVDPLDRLFNFVDEYKAVQTMLSNKGIGAFFKERVRRLSHGNGSSVDRSNQSQNNEQPIRQRK